MRAMFAAPQASNVPFVRALDWSAGCVCRFLFIILPVFLASRFTTPRTFPQGSPPVPLRRRAAER